MLFRFLFGWLYFFLSAFVCGPLDLCDIDGDVADRRSPEMKRVSGREEEVNNLSSSGSNQGRIKRRSASKKKNDAGAILFLFLFVYEGSFALVCVCEWVRLIVSAVLQIKHCQKIVELYLQCNKNGGMNRLCVQNEFH